MFNLIQSISAFYKDTKSIQRKFNQITKSDKQDKAPVQKQEKKTITLTEFMGLK